MSHYSKQSTCQTNIAAVNCQTPLTTTGSIGQAAGIIAAIVICLVAIVGVIVLLGACLWRNDFCIGGGSSAWENKHELKWIQYESIFLFTHL